MYQKHARWPKNLKVENWDWNELGERRLEGLKHVQILWCLNLQLSRDHKNGLWRVTRLLVTCTSLFMVAWQLVCVCTASVRNTESDSTVRCTEQVRFHEGRMKYHNEERATRQYLHHTRARIGQSVYGRQWKSTEKWARESKRWWPRLEIWIIQETSMKF